MTDLVKETQGHLFHSTGEKGSLTVMVDHSENLHHGKGLGLRIMIVFLPALSRPLTAVDAPHHLLEEWMTGLVTADMMTIT